MKRLQLLLTLTLLAGCTTQVAPNTNPASNTQPVAIDNQNTVDSNSIIQERYEANTNTESVAEIDTSDWQTYTNEEYKFSFKYPSEWTYIEHSNDEGLLQYVLFNSKNYNTPEYNEGPTPPLIVLINNVPIDCNNLSIDDPDEQIIDCSKRNINEYTFAYVDKKTPFFAAERSIEYQLVENNIVTLSFTTGGIQRSMITEDAQQIISDIMQSFQL